MKAFFISLLFFVALASIPANAQEEASSLMPMGAWLVGPATLEESANTSGHGMPCMMVNKFSNNIEMRISGGGGKIFAMALIVDSKVFEKDQSYLIALGFGDDAQSIQLPAQAFSESTLVVGLERETDFYKRLKESETMSVTLGEGKLQFSLLGAAQGLKRMESCYQPQAPVAPQPSVTEEAAGIRKIHPEVPDKIDEMIDQATSDALPVLPEQGKEEVAKVEEPEAPPKPVSGPAPAKEIKPRDILVPDASKAESRPGQQMRWRVMKGGGLQSVLDVWARNANARLVWKSSQSFSVPESLVMEGTFDEAVGAVLSQFPTGQPRPVGKIYNDPVLKQKVLVIEADMPSSGTTGEGNYAPIVTP